jgi:hypothetical protein
VDLEKLADVAALAVPCPACSGTLSPTSVSVAGMPIVVSASCPGCGRSFDFDWPAGHALMHPVIVDHETGSARVGGADWYAWRVLRCLASRDRPASVEITVRGQCRPGHEAVVVNCIDFLYGHVLLKLMSTPRHMRESPDADLVVIVPKLLSWLVPAGVVAIEVDLALSHGVEWVEGLDATVEEVLAPSSAVHISPAVSQPEVTDEDLAMLGVDLSPPKRDDRRDKRLQVGFIMRDDRLWLGPPGLALRLARLLLPKALVQRLLLRRQDRNYAKLAGSLRERHPDARFLALGIGHRGGLPAYVEDLRTPEPVREELPWLEIYRDCRVVVGIHGSNLLLPSLLAGAVVELLPDFKQRNLGEDLIIPRRNRPNPKLRLFRYRILPEVSPPATVATTVLSVLHDSDFKRQNFVESQRAYEAVGWPQPITWRHVAPEPASR